MHFTATAAATPAVTPTAIATLRAENDALIDARLALSDDQISFCEKVENLNALSSALQAQMNKLHNVDNQSTIAEWEELLAAYDEAFAEYSRMAVVSHMLTTREAELTNREADLHAELVALEQAVGMPLAAGGV